MMKALYRKSKILIHENQFMPQAVLYINCMGVWEYLLWCVPSLIECPLMYEINVSPQLSPSKASLYMTLHVE